MLPPQAVASAVRNGSDPNSLFQSNPLAQNMTPDAMASQPGLQQVPPPGSQAQNPMFPQQPDPSAGMQQPNAGVPGAAPQMDESMMLVQAVIDRLTHHSKVTEKTLAAIAKQLDANSAMQDGTAPANPPTAA